MKVTVVALRKEVSDGPLLARTSCEIPGGEVVALMGPSGCGKSTLLEIIAGLASATSGRVFLDATEVRPGYAPATLGYLPQESGDLILPWKTVEENVETVSRWRRNDPESPPFSSECLLERARLQHRRGRYPVVLSGGERRRLVLAMILSFCPTVMLLDEPFTGVDLDLKLDLWRLLHSYRLKRSQRPTVVLVTHNLDEAAILGDQVFFFRKGADGAEIRQAKSRRTFCDVDAMDPKVLYKDRHAILGKYTSYLDSELLSAVEGT